MNGHEILVTLDGQNFDRRDIFDPKWLEPLEMQLIAALAPSFDLFVDVGGNIGMYTNAVAKLQGSSIEIHTFEPDPLNFKCLQTSTSINNYETEIYLCNAAVSNVSGSLFLYQSESNRGDHRIFSACEKREKISVPCVKLDDYFSGKCIKNLMLKLDVQGAEHAALTGFQDTLERIRGDLAIILEFWPYGLHAASVAADELIDVLEAIGGDLYLIDEHSSSLFTIDIAWLRTYCAESLTVESQWFANLLLIRPSRMLHRVATRFLHK